MAGLCDNIHAWIERCRLPIPGGNTAVGAPVCEPLLCCDDHGLPALENTCTSLRQGGDGGTSATGGQSGSGGTSQLFGTVEKRRVYFPVGYRPGAALPDQVTTECCGVVSGSASANSHLHPPPADPACVVTVSRRRLYLPPGVTPGPKVCTESPQCCPPAGPPPLTFGPCGDCTWTVPQTLCLTLIPDNPSVYPAVSLTMPSAAFSILNLCPIIGWSGTNGSQQAWANYPCTIRVSDDIGCTASGNIRLLIQACPPPPIGFDFYALSTNGDPCDFNFTNCILDVRCADVLSWSPFLATVRAYLPSACCTPGASLADRAVTVVLTEGPC